MRNNVDVARGWIRKADSDLQNMRIAATLSDYAVSIRYDPEFWPERSDVEEALKAAEAIRAFVLKRTLHLEQRFE